MTEAQVAPPFDPASPPRDGAQISRDVFDTARSSITQIANPAMARRNNRALRRHAAVFLVLEPRSPRGPRSSAATGSINRLVVISPSEVYFSGPAR